MIDSLCVVATNDSVREIIKDRIEYKGETFKHEAMANKRQRLEWLQSKKKHDYSNVTSVRDDDKGLDARKPKRRWIKKSKFQSIQRQKRKQRINVVFFP